MKRLVSLLLCCLLGLFALTAGAENVPLAINQRIAVPENAEIVSGDAAVLADGQLCALATGTVTVKADGAETVYEVTPYTRICGMAAESPFAGPVAVWADFNQTTKELVHIDITGMGHPDVMAAYGADFAAFETAKEQFYNQPAETLANMDASDALSAAVKDACARYLSAPAFDIRPYQSLMTNRYLANNPHFEKLTGDVEVATSIVASWPEGSAVVETADVLNNDKVTWPLGVSSTTFTEGDAKYVVSHHAVKGMIPGVAVIAYQYGDTTVLDAVEVYENFTLELSGSDAYGKVVGTPADLSADILTYRVIGDKAMNFPGGTPGSTVIDVTFDRASRTILSVRITGHSDSPYLYNPWEYGGGFVSVGNQLYNIAAFTRLFAGLSADSDITPYALSSTRDNIVGGVVVDGGIDLVVTGATRTPNAVIAAVNAAIAQFRSDVK